MGISLARLLDNEMNVMNKATLCTPCPSCRSNLHHVDLFIFKILTSCLLCAFLFSCSTGSDHTLSVTEAQLANGTYKVSYGFNYPAADEQKILAITANLDRTSNQLTFSMQDGTQKVLSFTSRDKSQWQGDCRTMGSYVLDEVADLAPAPLQLESMVFNIPLVFAKCGPNRMILSITTSQIDSSAPVLIFDLIK